MNGEPIAQPVWIVDDDPAIRFVLEKALAREHLPTRSFDHASAVLEALASVEAGDAQAPQVLVSDIAMPGGNGLELLERLRQRWPDLPVIIMTAYSDLDSAVSAFQRGAFEYLPKPFDLHKATELIHRALQASQRSAAIQSAPETVPEMLGQAAAMQDLFRAIGRLSQSRATVLITGESGAGKELVARALHRHSPCAQGPFVAINTAAIPKDLLESELFGHERGAFTGAQAQRRGRFEQADNGTLFLDEIGDMPLELQTRLLRVLSDGRFYRVGGHAPVKAQVRVIAATHQALEQRVRDGLFREDLFHRLNVIRLRVPPLRERPEDVAPLARHFLLHSARQLGVEPKWISEAALQCLERYDFPGNVRQLENMCHWMTVMAPAQTIAVQDLPEEVRQHGMAGSPRPRAVPLVAAQDAPAMPAPAAVASGEALAPSQPAPEQVSAQNPPQPVDAPEWMQGLEQEIRSLLQAGTQAPWDGLQRQFEGTLIRVALELTQGHRKEAAQRLGIGRNTLTRKLQEWGEAPADGE